MSTTVTGLGPKCLTCKRELMPHDPIVTINATLGKPMGFTYPEKACWKQWWKPFQPKPERRTKSKSFPFDLKGRFTAHRRGYEYVVICTTNPQHNIYARTMKQVSAWMKEWSTHKFHAYPVLLGLERTDYCWPKASEGGMAIKERIAQLMHNDNVAFVKRCYCPYVGQFSLSVWANKAGHEFIDTTL